MLAKKIKYVDYDGNEREETFYFNLNKAEITEMEISTTGGLTRLVEKIVAEQDVQKIFEIFKELIIKAYGEKSPDGKRFVKSPELSKAFTETEAYVVLFMELSQSAEAVETFFNAIIPQSM